MTPGSALFGHSAKLVVSSRQKVGKKQTSAPVSLLEIVGGVDENGRAHGFHFTYQHKKSWLWTPNNGSVSISNLGKENRRLLTKDQYIKVALFAGYKGNNLQVFVMDIRQANSAKPDGTTWATKLEGGDGAAVHLHGHANVSYGKNAKYVDVALGLVDKVAKPITGVSLKQLQSAMGAKAISHGFRANGNALFELQALCQEFGLGVSIQDDSIHIAKPDEVAPGAEIFEWGPRTGLIGSPEYASPPQPGKPQLLKIRGLLFPQLKVGAKLRVESEEHSGEYLIREITHEGDTRGTTWNTEVNALPLKGAT